MEETAGERGGASSKTGYVALLRENRGFRLLWLGQVVSQLGDWFNTIAVYTLVLNLTDSGRAIGLVLVARFLPTVVIGPLAGVVADRYSRRRIMIVSTWCGPSSSSVSSSSAVPIKCGWCTR